jgi:hypothetical protein
MIFNVLFSNFDSNITSKHVYIWIDLFVLFFV